MISARFRLLSLVLALLPVLLYVAVAGVFAALSPQFRTSQTAVNILVQSSSAAIMAVGITFVLLSAGIDLSVGSVMFLAAAVAGKLVVSLEYGTTTGMMAMIAVGAACGLLNGLLITRLRMAPFIVTLAMLFVYRGSALWITETRAMNLPDAFRRLATAQVAGVPLSIWLLAVVLAAGHVLLTRTAFGRQLYAIGDDALAARKAGVPVARILLLAYGMAGVLAAVAGAITLAQLAAVSPTLGQGRELEAIAAAVLGGVSLFGGKGTVWGAALGAVTIQTLYTGLNTLDADPAIDLRVDPYVYPLITSGIIFLAVLLDSTRHRWLARRRAPKIRGTN